MKRKFRVKTFIFQQEDLETLRSLLTKYPMERFSVLHHHHQRLLLDYASTRNFTLMQLKHIEELVFPHFHQQKYYSLTLYYASLWARYYGEHHGYKQASICFQRAFIASEKVRNRMSS